MPAMRDELESLIAAMQDGGILYQEALREFKKRYLLRVLNANKGNECRAARELDMHRNTLSRTIAILQIVRDPQKRERFITLSDAVYRARKPVVRANAATFEQRRA